MKKTITQIYNRVRDASPLIHCITNPISIHPCANAILALGARPIMAEHPLEVAEITETAQALVLNLGNITDARMAAMGISAATARRRHIPFVMDAVGVACSTLRRRVCMDLIARGPTLIKGNYSEIYAIANEGYRAQGVDAAPLSPTEAARATVDLAKKYDTVVLASGKVDYISDGKRLFFVSNGVSQLSTVTGTGCMLGALCGCFLAVEQDIAAVVAACALSGICGEFAETPEGSGSFMVRLMNALSTISAKEIQSYVRMEEKDIESI